MSSEDSFMDIVRERLYAHDFLEAQGKPGLFFNKFLVDGITFYVDMRKKPMRLYGYRNVEGGRDAALEQEYVDKQLAEIRKDLLSIGCDLKNHGFEDLPEHANTHSPGDEKVQLSLYDILNDEQRAEVDKAIRLYGQAYCLVKMKEDNILGINVLVPEKFDVLVTAKKKPHVDKKFF